jgi:N6-adenosine-specific RNA methylase IME4
VIPAVRPSVLARALATSVAGPELAGDLASVYSRARAQPFRVICADPPWPFGDSLPGAKRGASKHYDLLSLDDIRDGNFLGGSFVRSETIDDLVADDAYLFLWRVAAGGGANNLTLAEEAYSVARAWSFTPKTEIVLRKRTKNDKRHFGMGWHVRNEHETCVLCVRGKPKPLVRNIRSIVSAVMPSGENGRAIHSSKPEKFYNRVVERISAGPYLELFARAHRPGWTCVGDQLTPVTSI